VNFMFDFRFHLISLTAVFLALGLGIIIGVAVIDEGILEKEQKYLVDRLEEDFNILRAQNNLARNEITEMQKKLDVWQDFSEEILPALIGEKLSGKKIVIIKTTDKGMPENLTVNLLKAGANVVFQFDLETFLLESGTAFANKPGISSKEKQKELQQGALLLAQRIYAGDFNAEETVSGDSCGAIVESSPDAVIIIGGADSQENFLAGQFDFPLISDLRSRGLVVAGTEVSGVLYSCIPQYLKLANIIVDQIDTIPGQVALIWALTGFEGYYGIGAQAVNLLPQLSINSN